MNPPASQSPVCHLDQYGLVVCRLCRYAIWPDQAVSHFRGKHKFSSDRRTAVQQDIARFDNLCTPQSFQLPPAIDIAINELPALAGFKCMADVSVCAYICTTLNGIRSHCQAVHQRSRFQHRGQPSRATRQQQQEQEIDAPLWTPVRCQRFFVQGSGSSFVEILAAAPAASNSINPPSTWQARVNELQQTSAAIAAHAQHNMQESRVKP
ncbi:hypothetical protein MMC22_009599 [Lobaria immixta]|nr:hypothetical protein [Lobaria immixta]